MNFQRLQTKNLALIFPYKLSLHQYHALGILSRELAPYRLLAKNFKQLLIFTYGDKRDLVYCSDLPQNTTVVIKNNKLPNWFYSIFLSLIHFRYFQQVDFCKVDQLYGAWSGILAKLIFQKYLIVRCGYISSLYYREINQLRKSLFISLIEKIVFSLADLVQVTSQEGSEYLKQRLKINPGKIKLVANYIDTARFSPKKINKYSNRVLFVGRLEKQKNLEFLINALVKTPITLDLVGEGTLKKKLKDLAKKNKIELNFLGVIPNEELPQLYNRYKLFVFPSLSEGMPKSLLEAMSTGLACIASDVAGNRELIQPQKNGLLLELKEEVWRAEIINLLNDSNKQSQFGEQARNFVIRHFDLKLKISEELTFYAQLIG